MKEGITFFIWCALTGTHEYFNDFIICHLAEVAKTTHKNVIGVGGTIKVIVQALDHGEKFGTLEPYFLGSSLDIVTLTHMSILDIKGGTNKYPHHN